MNLSKRKEERKGQLTNMAARKDKESGQARGLTRFERK